MNQLQALKILHFIAHQDGPSHEDLVAFGEKDDGLLDHAKRRDKALEVVAKMITAKIERKCKHRVPGGIAY